jgi:hypothetical protein
MERKVIFTNVKKPTSSLKLQRGLTKDKVHSFVKDKGMNFVTCSAAPAGVSCFHYNQHAAKKSTLYFNTAFVKVPKPDFYN